MDRSTTGDESSCISVTVACGNMYLFAIKSVEPVTMFVYITFTCTNNSTMQSKQRGGPTEIYFQLKKKWLISSI